MLEGFKSVLASFLYGSFLESILSNNVGQNLSKNPPSNICFSLILVPKSFSRVCRFKHHMWQRYPGVNGLKYLQDPLYILTRW